MSNQAVTTQSSTGIAQGQFDSVSFNVIIKSRGSTGPEAKEQTADIVQELQSCLASLREAGISFKDDEDRSTLNLVKEERWDDVRGQDVFSGYLALYSLKVKSTDVNKVSEIQDALTSIEGAEVDSPSFSQEPESRRELQKLALRNAFNVVTARLGEECEVLGLESADLEITSWNANYGRDRAYASASNFVAQAAMDRNEAAGGGPIEIRSGLAEVQVTLSVSYRWKHGC